jgi:hypothetical protein
MSVVLKQMPPDSNDMLMGLENFGYSIFPGCSTGFEIPIVNGKHNIGLDGPKDKDKRKKFETFFGVEFDSDRGREFLEQYEITVKHDIEAFDPEKNIRHEWDLHLMKVNNGMGIIAVSDEILENTPVNNFKFKLTDENRDLENKVTKKQIIVKAISKLGELMDSTSNRIVLIAKYIYPSGSGIATKNLAFAKLEEFISKNLENAEKFLDVTNLEPEYLDTVVKVKDAIFRGIIRLNQDGRYQLAMTGTVLGRSEEEVIQFCLSPANADIVGLGTKDDKPSSLTSQLKEK